jgi:hypothetical protein
MAAPTAASSPTMLLGIGSPGNKSIQPHPSSRTRHGPFTIIYHVMYKCHYSVPITPEPERRRMDVNAALTVSLLALVVRYSSELQQPTHATAIMSGHPHTRQAGWLDSEQGRAGSLHPESQGFEAP